VIRVLFFARIREQLGVSEVQLQDKPANIHALVEALEVAHGAHFGEKLRAANVIVACNQVVVDRSHVLKSNDEVAFYPPVTGG
jgi:molybdopterin synthase sulfur carrier subunit